MATKAAQHRVRGWVRRLVTITGEGRRVELDLELGHDVPGTTIAKGDVRRMVLRTPEGAATDGLGFDEAREIEATVAQSWTRAHGGRRYRVLRSQGPVDVLRRTPSRLERYIADRSGHFPACGATTTLIARLQAEHAGTAPRIARGEPGGT